MDLGALCCCYVEIHTHIVVLLRRASSVAGLFFAPKRVAMVLLRTAHVVILLSRAMEVAELHRRATSVPAGATWR